ncbi:MAG TPA: hypothetical protein DEA52_01015 [Clostridiaceae bacterium]|nr:hypothetical protein [Clostridiaceae bacterium]
MQKKDLLEIKKRYKKEAATFSKMAGCYVNGEKAIVTKFRETFLNLEDDEFHKYLEIAKKVLSGTIGNHILSLQFDEEKEEEQMQSFYMDLKRTRLLKDDLLDAFYEKVIDTYEYVGNYIILLFHDAYDVITKTEDNMKVDESEEVYEYVLCAICPVSLSDPGLSYVEDENKIRARHRDWVVEMPKNGFVYPAFIDRSQDIDQVMYYSKNPKEPHVELMEEILGCKVKETASLQKESFQAMVKGVLAEEKEDADGLFMDIQDQLHGRLVEFKETYSDADVAPMVLRQDEVEDLLRDSGVPEKHTVEIAKSYEQYYGVDLPLAESLLDQKVLKEKDQRRREEHLKKEVQLLQGELKKAKVEAPVEEYPVVMKVKDEKVSIIRTEMLGGKKCLVIPLEDHEGALVNGEKHGL